MIASSFRTVQDIYEYFLSFVNVEKGQTVEFKLDRMRQLASDLGAPEAACPCLHVAGSKGKGSVSVMLARILEASGRRTGLYASPHILDYRERITRAGDFFPDEAYLTAMRELSPFVVGKGPESFAGAELPSFFELTTLLAFLVFRGQACDAAVYETGLGGRLDSTNIVTPVASAITTIELEHTEYLGSTVRAIAGEKAGIIKPGRPVFTSARNPDAVSVFRDTARERGCDLSILYEDVALDEIRVTREGTEVVASFRDPDVFPEPVRLRTPMVGEIQAENAAFAALIARRSSFRVPQDAVLSGLSEAQVLARFQILPGSPPIVLDGAHTPSSVSNVVDTFSRLFPGPASLVFACAEDKHHAEMAGILRRSFRRVIITRPGTFKKSAPEAAGASFENAGFDVDLILDTQEALREGLRTAEEHGRPLLVTGSFYLCAQALATFADRS